MARLDRVEAAADLGGLELLPSTRREILRLVKHAGEARAEELAGALGITVSGLRQQLQALTADGYIVHREVRAGAGRPKHWYRLTPAAEALFPRGYRDLSVDLLDQVHDEDPKLVERLFARRRDRRLDRARVRLTGSLETRVHELTRLLDEDGYMADVEPLGDRGWRIVERNCAIIDVAMRYGHACASELDFLRAALPDAHVERVRHLATGSTTCAYEVRPR